MKTSRISTGSFDLNKWLFGGYETDIISMIAGPAGSGKTNFTVLVSCSQAKKGNKVLFVDTEGGFSSDRVKQIVGDEEYEKVLEWILEWNGDPIDKINNKPHVSDMYLFMYHKPLSKEPYCDEYNRKNTSSVIHCASSACGDNRKKIIESLL